MIVPDSTAPGKKPSPEKGAANTEDGKSPFRRTVTRKKFALERDGYQIDKTTYKQTF